MDFVNVSSMILNNTLCMNQQNKAILLIPSVKSSENIIGKLVVRSNMNLCRLGRSGHNVTATQESVLEIL